jgi:class 3 adenylate cyclase
MSGARVERKLAAILAVDVAGYSRLMGEDEEGTLATLRAIRRELGDPKIKEHRGRIVKTTGDGLLVEFASVVDAVRCAVETQREMATRNAGIPPEQRIEFRMGINLGDIIVEDGDIFGDGVNVAARLEALAQPGGICVSGSCAIRCATSSISRSLTWATSRSRTLHGPCALIAFSLGRRQSRRSGRPTQEPHPRGRWRRSRQSRCFLSLI